MRVRFVCFILVLYFILSPAVYVRADNNGNELFSQLLSTYNDVWVDRPNSLPSYKNMVHVYTVLSTGFNDKVVATIIANMMYNGYLTDSGTQTKLDSVVPLLKDSSSYNNSKVLGLRGQSVSDSIQGIRRYLGVDNLPVGWQDFYMTYDDFIQSRGSSEVMKKLALSYAVCYSQAWSPASSETLGNLVGIATELTSIFPVISTTDIQNAIYSNTDMLVGLYKEGYYTDEDLSEFNKLAEMDVQGQILNEATRRNLSQEQLSGLAIWRDNIDFTNKEDGFDAKIRYLVLALGIVFIIYGILLYLAYWFDKVNPLVEVGAVKVITLGRLQTALDDSDCNYGDTNVSGGSRLVNHVAVIKVCLTCIIFGGMVVSGVLFELILKLMSLAKYILGIGG